jgi:hypothetical protein
MPSFNEGDLVTYFYDGCWSAYIDEVVVPGSKYLIHFDGCVVPKYSKEAWPQEQEFLTVEEEDIEPRNASIKDAANRKAWLSAVYHSRKPVSKVLYSRFGLICRGLNVSWAVTDDEKGHLMEFSGVVKSLHAVGGGYALVYTGDRQQPTKMVSVALLD